MHDTTYKTLGALAVPVPILIRALTGIGMFGGLGLGATAAGIGIGTSYAVDSLRKSQSVSGKSWIESASLPLAIGVAGLVAYLYFKRKK